MTKRKLTQAEVAAIRAATAAAPRGKLWATCKQLAERHGVSTNTIYSVHTRAVYPPKGDPGTLFPQGSRWQRDGRW